MRWWRNRKERESDLDRELHDHVDLESEEQRANGLAPDEARRTALQSFGNTVSIKEDVREAWGLLWLDRLQQDLKYAFRVLIKTPTFSLMTVLILAISIGGTTAVFSQVNAVFWKLLPVSNPQQLRAVSWTSPRRAFMGTGLASASALPIVERFSYPVYLSVRDRITTFSDIACWQDPGENQPLIIDQYGRAQDNWCPATTFECWEPCQSWGAPSLPMTIGWA